MSDTRFCPHCAKEMEYWLAPSETCWGRIWVCFNNECSFYLNSAQDVQNKGEANRGLGCRYAEDPANNNHPVNMLAVCPF